MPFTPIHTLEQLEHMREGFFAGDELWLWMDSRASRSEKNKAVADILLKSRKRDITIAFTAQSAHQVDKRIKDVTDFIAYPMMSVDGRFCRLEMFRGPRPHLGTRIKPPIYFLCEDVYAMYNTYEEVKVVSEGGEGIGEISLPITDNPAWLRYLAKEKGVTDQNQVEKITKRVLDRINSFSR